MPSFPSVQVVMVHIKTRWHMPSAISTADVPPMLLVVRTKRCEVSKRLADTILGIDRVNSTWHGSSGKRHAAPKSPAIGNLLMAHMGCVGRDSNTVRRDPVQFGIPQKWWPYRPQIRRSGAPLRDRKRMCFRRHVLENWGTHMDTYLNFLIGKCGSATEWA